MKISQAEIDQRMEQFKVAARQTGIKLTHQRLEIFREIVSTDAHPDAELLFRAVQARMPTVSLDTVYRTLWMLTDLGLITTLGPRRDSVRFDANLELHHHFVCMRCGLARDFESPPFNELPVPEGVRQFGRIISTHVEARGICGDCQKKNGSPTGRKRIPTTAARPLKEKN